jgi:hypothetical protein
MQRFSLGCQRYDLAERQVIAPGANGLERLATGFQARQKATQNPQPYLHGLKLTISTLNKLF